MSAGEISDCSGPCRRRLLISGCYFREVSGPLSRMGRILNTKGEGRKFIWGGGENRGGSEEGLSILKIFCMLGLGGFCVLVSMNSL